MTPGSVRASMSTRVGPRRMRDGETPRSCIWTHCSSVTDKQTFAPGKETDVVPETQTQGACESALRDLWEEIEGPAESFQRRRIKRLFF